MHPIFFGKEKKKPNLQTSNNEEIGDSGSKTLDLGAPQCPGSKSQTIKNEKKASEFRKSPFRSKCREKKKCKET